MCWRCWRNLTTKLSCQYQNSTNFHGFGSPMHSPESAARKQDFFDQVQKHTSEKCNTFALQFESSAAAASAREVHVQRLWRQRHLQHQRRRSTCKDCSPRSSRGGSARAGTSDAQEVQRLDVRFHTYIPV